MSRKNTTAKVMTGLLSAESDMITQRFLQQRKKLLQSLNR